MYLGDLGAGATVFSKLSLCKGAFLGRFMVFQDCRLVRATILKWNFSDGGL
jgi:hypothetical protein